MNMKSNVIRFVCLLLVIATVLPLAACGKKKETNYDGEALLQSLLTQVKFDDTLESVGDRALLYFGELPEGTTAKLYMGSGYFADEVVLFTLPSEKDQATAMEAARAHLAELEDQFSKYIPEEVSKIQKAVIWQGGKYLILVITNDHANAKLILDNASDPNYKLPGGNTPPVTTAPPETTVPPTSAVPTVPPTTNEPTVPPTTTEPTTPPTTTEPTTPPTTKPVENPNGAGSSICVGVDPNTGYPILQSLSGTFVNYNGIIRVDNRAMELIGYNDKNSTNYCNLVSKVADALAGICKVYCLPITTSIGIMVPDDIKINYKNQGDSIDKILGKMSANVIGVDIYENMMKHRDEYLYFRTDHHWNGIGAYYAYEVFCQVKGVTPYTMEQREEVIFDGFLGTLYTNKNVNKDPALKPADSVYAYKPYHNVTMTYYDNKGNGTKWSVISNVKNYGSGSKYLTFAAGDQPLAIFKNSSVTDGSVCIVIKESYGNALLPYVVDHYSTVYEIDYRHWKGDLIAYAKEVGADDILFANNVGMISSSGLVGKLGNIIP